MPFDEETRNLARGVDDALARALPPPVAKLYAEHIRLETGQQGLEGWRAAEFSNRLEDALRLMQTAFVLRETDIRRSERALRRAGEILEWLAHPQLNEDELPLELLAAGCYQLAGYPARAGSLLQRSGRALDSKILSAFLRSDFEALSQHLTAYWSVLQQPALEEDEAEASIPAWLVDQTISAIGVVYSTVRWGGEWRSRVAVDKLDAISGVLLGGGDAVSSILSRLVAETANRYMSTTLRNLLNPLRDDLNNEGRRALERYVRASFSEGKSLAWPSQIRGIDRLRAQESAAIFTPTGSGKTTVAEVAILQSLFPSEGINADEDELAPLVMYLTPSRALSAEIEHKLASVLRRLGPASVTVTGLYGGTDWGPTDAWLASDQPTVVVCTYEKAEALIRFLGPLFVERVVLVVIDEAHSVQLSSLSGLRTGDSRELRLESLGSRLHSYLPEGTRFIAISAVATGLETTLTRWMTAGESDQAAVSDYRSTRQLIGRVSYRPSGTFRIFYDLLDGESLEFEDEGEQTRPFVPQPFPRMRPPDGFEGPEKRLRPAVLWAAAHLAASVTPGQRGRGVLISMTQNLGDYAKSFLELLDGEWENSLPEFFAPPTEPSRRALWENCLSSCADYFGDESREYRLLEHGIAVHHGNMPGLLARLIVEVVDARIVTIVLATSTLSQGVNLPFEVVLLPSMLRWDPAAQRKKPLSVQEFKNLAGRAGRPGFGTEGQALVFLQPEDNSPGATQARAAYAAARRDIAGGEDAPQRPVSPIASLIQQIRQSWRRIAAEDTEEAFFAWLETVTPIDPGVDERPAAVEAVDSLDAILVAELVEAEARVQDAPLETERLLRDAWRRTYAYFATDGERFLEDVFVRRGTALDERIYPPSDERTRLYRTSLRPSDAQGVLEASPEIIARLQLGTDYAVWEREAQFGFIRDVVEDIARIPKFARTSESVGKGGAAASWGQVLRWWIRAPDAPQPAPARVADWYGYVHKNFGYRFNWGLGSVLGAWVSEQHEGELLPLTLDDWAEGDLPWIAFWIKELLTWGTLDPVAAYILSRRLVFTRDEAEEHASSYYGDVDAQDDPLDPRNVRAWSSELGDRGQRRRLSPPRSLDVELVRNFRGRRKSHRVVPVRDGNSRFVSWVDLAGFALARSRQPDSWRWSFRDTHDFTLNASARVVRSRRY